MVAVAIRLATVADAGAINDIYNHYVVHSTCTAEVTPVDLETRQRWFAGRDLARFPVTIAEDAGGVVLGWASISPYHARWGYRFTVENSVYVRHDGHRRGVGRALLGDLVARAGAAGHHSIIALVAGDQPGSLALHESAGFVRRGRLSQVIHKLDRWLDLEILQRDLGVGV